MMVKHRNIQNCNKVGSPLSKNYFKYLYCLKKKTDRLWDVRLCRHICCDTCGNERTASCCDYGIGVITVVM